MTVESSGVTSGMRPTRFFWEMRVMSGRMVSICLHVVVLRPMSSLSAETTVPATCGSAELICEMTARVMFRLTLMSSVLLTSELTASSSTSSV